MSANMIGGRGAPQRRCGACAEGREDCCGEMRLWVGVGTTMPPTVRLPRNFQLNLTNAASPTRSDRNLPNSIYKSIYTKNVAPKKFTTARRPP